MLKRIGIILLIVAMLASWFVPVASAASTTPKITQTQVNYPSSLEKGSSFNLRGIYTTNVGKITKVTATLKDSSGIEKYYFTATPNTKSFDVYSTTGTGGKTLNNTIKFGSLASGTYTLRIEITAKNGTASTSVVVNKTITVKPKISASGTQSPTASNSYTLKGKYSTNGGKITSVSAVLYYSYGAPRTTYSASPNTSSVDLSTLKNSSGTALSSYLNLKNLPNGTYNLNITICAKDNGISSAYTVTYPITVNKASSTPQSRIYYNLKDLPKVALDNFIRMLEACPTNCACYSLTQYNGTYCLKIYANNQYYYLAETALIATSTDATAFPKATNSMTNALRNKTGASDSVYYIKRSPFETNETDIRLTCVDNIATQKGDNSIRIAATVRASLYFTYNKYTKTIYVNSKNYNGLKVLPQYTLASSNLSQVGFNHYYACAYGLAESSKTIDAGKLIQIGYQIGTAVYKKDIETLATMFAGFVWDYCREKKNGSRALYTLKRFDDNGNEIPYGSELGETLTVENGAIDCTDSTCPIYLGYDGDYFEVIVETDNDIWQSKTLRNYLTISYCFESDLGLGIMVGSRKPTVTSP